MAELPEPSSPRSFAGDSEVPFARWKQSVTEGRDRIGHLWDLAAESTTESSNRGDALHELTLTYEELAVAEDELRAQNEELLLAQTHLEVDRARYRELFESAPVAYLVTDASGTIKDANHAAGSLLHIRSDRLRGKPLAVFTPADSRRILRENILAIGRTPGILTFEVGVRSRAGVTIPVDVRAGAAYGRGGAVQEIRWLLTDQRPRRRHTGARQRRAAELERLVAQRTTEMQEAQALKDQLVAVVSHELRTPLSAIGGYTELLAMGLRGALNEAQLLDVQRIQRAYEHLARIVDDLLSYSRLAARQLTFELADVRLAPIVAGVVELVMPQAADGGIAVEVVGGWEGLGVRADAERVQQILLNIVGNAVKFTPAGGHVRICPRTSRAALIIDVEDTGPGISADERDTIFEPFVRLVVAEAAPGTGLGLAISRDLARAMGGDVTVTSTVGIGSCFSLRLPLSIDPAPAHAENRNEMG